MLLVTQQSSYLKCEAVLVCVGVCEFASVCITMHACVTVSSPLHECVLFACVCVCV